MGFWGGVVLGVGVVVVVVGVVWLCEFWVGVLGSGPGPRVVFSFLCFASFVVGCCWLDFHE